MPRLKRFDASRFVGTRDDMVVYDCDDPDDFETLSGRVDNDRLVERKLVQVFGPDSLPEARNRGYNPR